MVTLSVDDIEAHAREVSARGIAISPGRADGAPFRLAQVRDPDGNLITFAQDVRPDAATRAARFGAKDVGESPWIEGP
jgi:hypothetical protein